jgi:predicted nucleic acid-binding protein
MEEQRPPNHLELSITFDSNDQGVLVANHVVTDEVHALRILAATLQIVDEATDALARKSGKSKQEVMLLAKAMAQIPQVVHYHSPSGKPSPTVGNN